MNEPPRFARGDAVVDTDAEDAEPMYVLEPARGQADEIHIEALDATVAEVNPEYPETDRVVECIHQSWLEHNVGTRWQSWDSAAFVERLQSFTREWSLTPKTYDYPASRLALADSDDDQHQPQSDRPATDSGQTSMSEWTRGAGNHSDG